MRFRRIFKNVPARRWFPKYNLSEVHQRAMVKRLKCVTAILMEKNAILNDLVYADAVGKVCHAPLGYWHAQSEDGKSYWCEMDQQWKLLPGEIPEAWRVTT